MTEPTQWEMIFRNDPHFFLEPLPQAVRFTEHLLERDLSSALDIGCGGGRHVIHMTKHGLRAAGLDNAPTALRMTREWLDQEKLDARLVLSDMRVSLPFADNSFDGVLSTQVIHHALLATVIGTAREIERIVRPQGMILLSIPARSPSMTETAEHILLEPNTYAPTGGEEKGLPHHFFSPEEFRDIFPNFDVLDLRVEDGRVIILEAIKK
ncbi:MAG: class I SAM-dependent methyltransferase [Chloroflexi bacterium]|nr:class I SAM-dependent methyltransferase [Chloroflexota bacterium]